MSNKILYQRILLLYLSGVCENSLIIYYTKPSNNFEGRGCRCVRDRVLMMLVRTRVRHISSVNETLSCMNTGYEFSSHMVVVSITTNCYVHWD